MRLRVAAFLLGLISTSVSLSGQVVDMARDHVSITELAGPWRFHAGDDAAWASAGFDDSGWPLLEAGKPWSMQGYRRYGGVGWYRVRILLPPDAGPMALFLPNVGESCEVFADGQRIGGIGGMPPHAKYVVENNVLFPIPASESAGGLPLVIAIRVWHWPGLAGLTTGGLLSVPRIGAAGVVANWRQLQIHHAFWRNAAAIFDVFIDALTALAGIGLFLLRRREREYLWWGLSQGFWAAFAALDVSASFLAIPWTSGYSAYVITNLLAAFLQIVFYALFLRQRWGRLFWSAAVLFVTGAAVQLWFVFDPSGSLGFGATAFTGMLAQVCVVGMLWVGARRGHPDAPLLLVPNCLMLACNIMRAGVSLPVLGATASAAWISGFLNSTITWPFTIGAFQLAGDFEMFAVLVILVRAYARSRRDEERLESELEAARAVQSVLIPSEIPRIPGFALETVYQPASQVGGDFFQVIALEDGGALIAIGDVSGKGMPAAMTVSLLVGTFRTLAHFSQDPSEILEAMNQRMMARSNGGFTTCLVLRADPDGRLTAANAGHLAPYLSGKELALENGFPLGLEAKATYADSGFELRLGEELTLLTDGVPEARNAEGALFGFDRTAAISTQPAETIAETVRRFGQEDDVTVVRLALSPAAVFDRPALASAG
ncbi:MAG TPA: SpoIIE family protein phosphatase [Terracidiphilus sp.]|nr:SpoIIE family protein phosphatase [Terracidiphilus sp.]